MPAPAGWRSAAGGRVGSGSGGAARAAVARSSGRRDGLDDFGLRCRVRKELCRDPGRL